MARQHRNVDGSKAHSSDGASRVAWDYGPECQCLGTLFRGWKMSSSFSPFVFTFRMNLFYKVPFAVAMN